MTARRTLDPDWPKMEREDKLEEEDEDDSDSYPGSDSIPVRSKNQISKFQRWKTAQDLLRFSV